MNAPRFTPLRGFLVVTLVAIVSVVGATVYVQRRIDRLSARIQEEDRRIREEIQRLELRLRLERAKLQEIEIERAKLDAGAP